MDSQLLTPNGHAPARPRRGPEGPGSQPPPVGAGAERDCRYGQGGPVVRRRHHRDHRLRTQSQYSSVPSDPPGVPRREGLPRLDDNQPPRRTERYAGGSSRPVGASWGQPAREPRWARRCPCSRPSRFSDTVGLPLQGLTAALAPAHRCGGYRERRLALAATAARRADRRPTRLPLPPKLSVEVHGKVSRR